MSAEPKADTPWDDCKVAFGVSDGYAVADKIEKPLWRDRLPSGWAWNEMDAQGARCVMVFRVAGVPTAEDGRVVRRLLDRMEPRPKREATDRISPASEVAGT